MGEMREIAATQADAGLPRELFDGFAVLYEALARSPLGREDPESLEAAPALEAVLEALMPAGRRS